VSQSSFQNLETAYRAGSDGQNSHLDQPNSVEWTAQTVGVDSGRADKDYQRVDNAGLGTGDSW
jgi:hypothetical protein